MIRSTTTSARTTSTIAGLAGTSSVQPPSSRALRLGASLAALAIASTMAAGAADAHVRVTPDTATVGSYTTLTFKVPNESDKASTTKVTIDLPTDHPFAYVSYLPVPGWNADVTTKKLAKPMTTLHGETLSEVPSTLTWTADKDAVIKPGQFQQFTISAGPMPGATTLNFPSHQTYSDGKVVNWTDVAKPGAEPEHPAPTLKVVAPGTAPSTNVTTSPLQQSKSAERLSRSQDDTTARWLGAAGIVIGLVGILAAVFVATRRSSR